MIWIKTAIVLYILGLITFYTCAVFDTMAWDWTYFAWSKIADIGIMGWGCLYYNLKSDKRHLVKWLFCFSIIRFIFDIQTLFTGVGVNNEVVVAALFLILILVVCIFSFREFKKFNKHIV